MSERKKKRITMDEPCVQPGVTFEERDGGRFCRSCGQMQFDLTQATEREALALFAAHGDRLCGRFRAGPSGELRFRPEPPTRAGGVGALIALTLAACDRPEPTTAVAPETTIAPPTIVAAPPPTTDVVSAPTSEPDHSTDTSTDPANHDNHWHTHQPVTIGERQIHGGARAHTRTTTTSGDPLDDL
jgi:hypothetical protein